MKKKTLMLLCLLLLSLQFTGSVAQDGNQTVIHNVTVDRVNATVGDKITFSVDVSDADGISYVEGYLYNTYHMEATSKYLSLEYNSTTGLYSGFYIVSAYDTNEILFLGDIYVQDNVNNWIYFRNSNYFTTEIGQPTFQAQGVDIYGTNPDYTAPVLHHFEFIPSSVNAGETVKVRANATDDNSGVNYIYFDLYRRFNTSFDYGIGYMGYYYMQYNVSSGFYYHQFSTDFYWPDGEYYVAISEISDNAGNHIYLEERYNDFTSDSLFVNNNANLRPDINSVNFEKDIVKSISQQTLYLNISMNEFQLNDGYVYLIAEEYDNNYYSYDQAYFSSSNYNATSGLYEIDLNNLYDYAWNDMMPIEVSSININGYNLTTGNYYNLRYYAPYDFVSDSFILTNLEQELNQISFSMNSFPSDNSEPEESVIFDFKIISGFMDSQNNLPMTIEISGPGLYETNNRTINLGPLDTLSVDFEYAFPEAGNYELIVSVIDTAGVEWSENYFWEVVEPVTTTDPPSATSETANGSITPELQLAGFEFVMTMLGFSSVLVLNYRRKN